MLQIPYRSMDDTVAGLGALEQQFLARGDRRSIFVTLYGTVSAEIRDRLATGFFADSAWVQRYAVAFANLYRVAVAHEEAGRTDQVPKSWQICFDAARDGRGLVIQDMLLGVNAHVNHDLPFTLHTVSIDPDRDARYRDHAAVNAVLASVAGRATERLAALYAPGLRSITEAAGPLDEILSTFSLEVARESAWEAAVALTNARTGVERRLTGRLIESRAALMARLLRAPSRHPALVALGRHLESGPEWLRVASGVVARARLPHAGT
jgi:hypothetical protein